MAMCTTPSNDEIVVTDYPLCADPSGSLDSTSAFNTALATTPTSGGSLRVYVPAGKYKISGTLNITNVNTALVGAGSETTLLIMTGNSTAPAIQVFSWLPGSPLASSLGQDLQSVRISGMTIERSVQATAGGDGVVVGGYDKNNNWVGFISKAFIDDVVCQHHYRGFLLGSTAKGFVRLSVAANCQSDGFQFVNAQNTTGNTSPGIVANAAALQWFLDTTISELNVANGYHVFGQPVTGLGSGNPITIFTWVNTVSFANTGYGLYVEGQGGTTPAPLSGLLLLAPYFGADNKHEVYFSSYGAQHKIIGGVFQLAGNALTGPLSNYYNQTTSFPTQASPTLTASGVVFDNTYDFTIQGSNITGNSNFGIAISNSGSTGTVEGQVTDCRIVANSVKFTGSPPSPSQNNSYSGINVSGYGTSGAKTNVIISGCRIGNPVGSPYQFNGIALGTATSSVVTGGDLRGNTNVAIALVSGTPTPIVLVVGCDMTGYATPVFPSTTITSGHPTGSFNLT